MAYYGWSDATNHDVYEHYIAKLTEYVVWLIETGRRIKFVIGKDSDADAVEDVRRQVLNFSPEFASSLIHSSRPDSLHDVMRQLSEADIVVATRFHTVVCALRAGRPTVSIGYAAKNQALLAEMGLGQFHLGH